MEPAARLLTRQVSGTCVSASMSETCGANGATVLIGAYCPRVIPALLSTSAGTPNSRQVAYAMPLRLP